MSQYPTEDEQRTIDRAERFLRESLPGYAVHVDHGEMIVDEDGEFAGWFMGDDVWRVVVSLRQQAWFTPARMTSLSDISLLSHIAQRSELEILRRIVYGMSFEQWATQHED